MVLTVKAILALFRNSRYLLKLRVILSVQNERKSKSFRNLITKLQIQKVHFGDQPTVINVLYYYDG